MTEAWALARQAAAAAAVELRPVESADEADRLLDVMHETWGEVPFQREVVRALAESGNVPWGAFDEGKLVGFVLGWIGLEGGELHVHSHMLAVSARRQAAGIGYVLKLAQRAAALEQDIHLARWTFDPLVARNAYFNLRKLGATCDRFGRSFYGDMDDALNRGDRSDRLVVRWELDRDPDSPRGDMWSGGPEPTSENARPEHGATVEIPADHPSLRGLDPGLGVRWRNAVANALEGCFSAGLHVLDFRRDSCAYVCGTAEAPT